MNNHSKKLAIMTLIERGLSNPEIKQATGASREYISKVRGLYNACLPPEQRKRSQPRLTKPNIGTKSRIVYDYMELYPNARHSEVMKDTGLSSSVCGRVRHLFFTPTAKEKIRKII